MVFYLKQKMNLKKYYTLISKSFSQIFFIPALKINFYLKNFKKYFSGRKILIAKELTKIHETFLEKILMI